MKTECSILVILVVFLGAVESRTFDASDPADPLAKLSEKVANLSRSVKNTIGTMARQMMLQQLFVEERIRSDGDSGVKQIRHFREGTRNYFAATHTSAASVLAIHDHSNNDRTVGMGEFIGVLNGVEFRTRHNDYRLYMPHRTSSTLHATENIPFPDVPPDVTKKSTVKEQIVEMQEWFKAWKNQDYSKRDYRKYFRPVICYLEGAWTAATQGKIDEPFESDRHFIDASSWFDLQEKIRFTSYTGRKDDLENFSFLPTTIMNVTDEGIPNFAQWNYRILCHPISRDLPLNRLRVVDELGSRISAKRTYNEHSNTRAARFQMNPFDTDKWTERENRNRFNLLDEIMSEVPGKDNYQGNLKDTAFGLSAFSLAKGQNGVPLRADRYHRWFKVERNDAMGVATRHRGFADENLFMAMNTQPKVQGMDLHRCEKGQNGACSTLHQKWSYAIPLEIIYLTPLSKWNPYDIEYKGRYRTPLGRTVDSGGRNGGQSLDKAYNGTNSIKFYQTPAEFFSGNEVGSGAADTTKNSVGVLDKKGNLRACKASGTRIFFPPILGVGLLRQRYPIMPVHGEGSAAWKELEAVKDLVLNSKTNGYIFKEPLQSGPLPTEPPRKDLKLQVQLATAKVPGPHNHELFITADQVDFMKSGGILHGIQTTLASGHEHTMSLRWNRYRKYFYIYKCDSKDTRSRRCWDQHFVTLIVMPDQ